MEIPDWFIVGLTFKGKWIENRICEVISFNEVTNLLVIKLSPSVDAPSYVQTFTEDGWNLQHTLWGFEKGEYIKI